MRLRKYSIGLCYCLLGASLIGYAQTSTPSTHSPASSVDSPIQILTADTAKIAPPEHPVTEATLRTFYELSHAGEVRRQSLEKEIEVFSSKTPPWYPPDIHNENIQALRAIDLVRVALPIYQKYISEEAVQSLNNFMATPSGQQIAHDINASRIQSLKDGDTYSQTHGKAQTIARSESGGKPGVLAFKAMSKEDRKMLKNSDTMKQIKQISAIEYQLHAECAAALSAKQKAVLHEIAIKNKYELKSALDTYRAAHPDYVPGAIKSSSQVADIPLPAPDVQTKPPQ